MKRRRPVSPGHRVDVALVNRVVRCTGSRSSRRRHRCRSARIVVRGVMCANRCIRCIECNERIGQSSRMHERLVGVFGHARDEELVVSSGKNNVGLGHVAVLLGDRAPGRIEHVVCAIRYLGELPCAVSNVFHYIAQVAKAMELAEVELVCRVCLLYTSPSPRD